MTTQDAAHHTNQDHLGCAITRPRRSLRDKQGSSTWSRSTGRSRPSTTATQGGAAAPVASRYRVGGGTPAGTTSDERVRQRCRPNEHRSRSQVPPRASTRAEPISAEPHCVVSHNTDDQLVPESSDRGREGVRKAIRKRRRIAERATTEERHGDRTARSQSAWNV